MRKQPLPTTPELGGHQALFVSFGHRAEPIDAFVDSNQLARLDHSRYLPGACTKGKQLIKGDYSVLASRQSVDPQRFHIVIGPWLDGTACGARHTSF